MDHIVIWVAFATFVMAALGFADHGWYATRNGLRLTCALSYAMTFVMSCLAALVLSLWYGV